jgi:hypothetical protein
MNLNRKKAPGRLTRAIVALAVSTGKKLTWIRNNDRASDAAGDNHINRGTEDFEGYVRLSERTTITVETERLLIVSRERRSSSKRAECGSEGRPLSRQGAEPGRRAP